MNNQAKTFPVLGRNLTVEQLSAGCLTLGCTVVVCDLLGFPLIALSIIVAAALAVVAWALHLNDLSKSPSERFAQLRRLVQLRRAGESENSQISDTPMPVVIIIGCIVVAICMHHLLSARQQFAASDYPFVMGLMTQHEMVDVGMVGSELEVEYEYAVGGQNFRGNDFRFLYRPYRVGTVNAKILAGNWGQGAQIPVFYNPNNPAEAAIDNTYCKGDRLFVALNAVVMIAAFLVVGLFVYFRRSKTTCPRLQFETDTARNVILIRLSNVPFYGMYGLSITLVSFFLLLVALVGGFVSMGNAAVPWLVSTIDWMLVVSVGLLTASVFCCVAECISHGFGGRTCEIDEIRKRITVQREGFSEAVAIDTDQIDSIRVVSSRDSWVRLGRTFSPTIFYRDSSGKNAKVVLQRNLNRNQAINLVNRLRTIIALRPDSHAEALGTLAVAGSRV